MLTTIRRALAGTAVVTAATAASMAGGLATPAQAADGYWVEKYSDHTDVVVDWFAVPIAADDAGNNLPVCVEASRQIGPLWLIDQAICPSFVEQCAEIANRDYPGHAIRVSFYEFRNECRVLG